MSSRGLTRGVGGQSPESARFITFARGPAPEQGLNINAAVAAWQDRLGLWMLGPTEQVSSCWTRRVAATRPGAPTVAPSTSYTPADAGAMTCTQATTPTQVRSSLANSGGDGSTTQAGRTSRSHLHQPGPALPNQLVSRGGDFDSRYVKRCPDGHFAKASQWARQSRAAIRGEGGSRAGRDRRAASAVRGGAGPLVVAQRGGLYRSGAPPRPMRARCPPSSSVSSQKFHHKRRAASPSVGLPPTHVSSQTPGQVPGSSWSILGEPPTGTPGKMP
jgi:hypothetical protein